MVLLHARHKAKSSVGWRANHPLKIFSSNHDDWKCLTRFFSSFLNKTVHLTIYNNKHTLYDPIYLLIDPPIDLSCPPPVIAIASRQNCTRYYTYAYIAYYVTVVNCDITIAHAQNRTCARTESLIGTLHPNRNLPGTPAHTITALMVARGSFHVRTALAPRR